MKGAYVTLTTFINLAVLTGLEPAYPRETTELAAIADTAP